MPISLYGSDICSIPKNHNLLYLEQIPENVSTRQITSEIVKKICGKRLIFQSARQVGKRNPITQLKILIHVKHIDISDK